MKYALISGHIVFLLCTVSLFSASYEASRSQTKAKDFLFNHFDISPSIDLLPKDIQHLIVKRLQDLIVGKSGFGKPFRETKKPQEWHPLTVQEKLLALGKSALSSAVPGTCEDLPPHFKGRMLDMVFTEDDKHVVAATDLMHVVVDLHTERPEQHGAATFVEFIDFKDKPKPAYVIEYPDREKFDPIDGWDCARSEQDDSEKEGIMRFIHRLPLVFYKERSRINGMPLWKERGDLARLLKLAPIKELQFSSDRKLHVKAGSEDREFMSIDQALIDAYRRLDQIDEVPFNKVWCSVPPSTLIAYDTTALFCQFVDLPPEHPHYNITMKGPLRKIGRGYRSILSSNRRYLLLMIRDYKIPEPDEVGKACDLEKKFCYHAETQLHVWDLQEGTCLQKCKINGRVNQADISSNGQFLLLTCSSCRGDIDSDCPVVILFHVMSGIIIAYEKGLRGSSMPVFSGNGTLFVVDGSSLENSIGRKALPFVHLEIWKLGQFMELEQLYLCNLTIEEALFILLLRELKSKGLSLKTALPELAQKASIDEAVLSDHFKNFYRTLPKALKQYLIKLMGPEGFVLLV